MTTGILPLGAYNPGFMGSLGNLGGNYQTPMGGMEVMNPAQNFSLNPTTSLLPNVQGAGNMAGWGGIQGLGANLDTLKLGVGGLSALAGLWNGFQQNSLAKKSFNHQKGILDTNLANSIKAYNLSVDDKFRSRAVVEGMSNAERDAAIERNKARDERRG